MLNIIHAYLHDPLKGHPSIGSSMWREEKGSNLALPSNLKNLCEFEAILATASRFATEGLLF
jgi:hypothetical protein